MTGQAPRFSVSRWVLGTYYTNLMFISSTHLRNMLTKQQNIDIKKMKKKAWLHGSFCHTYRYNYFNTISVPCQTWDINPSRQKARNLHKSGCSHVAQHETQFWEAVQRLAGQPLKALPSVATWLSIHFGGVKYTDGDATGDCEKGAIPIISPC